MTRLGRKSEAGLTKEVKLIHIKKTPYPTAMKPDTERVVTLALGNVLSNRLVTASVEEVRGGKPERGERARLLHSEAANHLIGCCVSSCTRKRIHIRLLRYEKGKSREAQEWRGHLGSDQGKTRVRGSHKQPSNILSWVKSFLDNASSRPST